MKFIGIIPARYASTRFPGKPLVEINGKTMIRRVYEQACKSVSLDIVYVATDDERIYQHVEEFGNVVYTSENHQSGTDRCMEAIQLIKKNHNYDDYDVVINIQGDEPFINPSQINSLAESFNDKEVEIATLIKKITSSIELFEENVVKVIHNHKMQAIYFSRAALPFCRNFHNEKWLDQNDYYKHIGIYAYRIDVLKRITNLIQSRLEKAESLEQLRWIENGFAIKVIETQEDSFSIDTPGDIKNLPPYLT
jgi:3-deoxy-manno-octulosonate cytidylyltransferase (CMP-KDO synthetase)